MSKEFWIAAGQVIGVFVSLGLLGLMFVIGRSWNDVKRDVSFTTKAVGRIEPKVDEHASALQRITHTLHGPEGNNGLYGTVKALDTRFDEFERRLRDISPNPGRRKTDRARRTA